MGTQEVHENVPREPGRGAGAVGDGRENLAADPFRPDRLVRRRLRLVVHRARHHHRPHLRPALGGAVPDRRHDRSAVAGLVAPRSRRGAVRADVGGLRRESRHRRPARHADPGRVGAQHRPCHLLRPRPDRLVAVPLLRRSQQRPVVRRRRVGRLLLALHRPAGRDRHAVRRQPAPVEPLHATLRHRLVRRLHHVRPPADGATMDGGRRQERGGPAPRRPPAAAATDGQRLAAHRPRLVREGVGHRTGLGQPDGRHAVAALCVRPVRRGVLLQVGEELVAPGADAALSADDGHGTDVLRRALLRRRAGRIRRRRIVVPPVEPHRALLGSAPGQCRAG